MIETDEKFEQADHHAQQLIRRTRQITRRRFTPEEKVRILTEGIRGEIPVSLLCRRESIGTNVYYKWLKGDILREANRAEVETLKQENQRLKELVAQLSLENLVLKKSLG